MTPKRILFLRKKLATYYFLNKLKNKDFTIISDNCWGASLYKQLGLKHKTPTIGLGMGKHGYLNFIEKLNTCEATNFIKELDSSHCYPLIPQVIYPVGKTSLATIHFLHYKTYESAIRLFKIRYHTINWKNIFYKIDFEHDYYKPEHIQRWNDMKLPNSVAFYSKRVKKIWNGDIHNGVYIDKWEKETSYILDNFQGKFNYIEWLNSGKITTSVNYRILNFLILNPSGPKKAIGLLKNKVPKFKFKRSGAGVQEHGFINNGSN